MQSPFGGWRHHLARWEACHLILSRLWLPTNQVPLPPQGETRNLEGPSFCLPDRTGAGRSPEEHRKILKRPDAPILRRLTAPPPSCGRGLLLFAMQHWRHKSKSCNADYILIAAKGGDTTTLSPKGCRPLLHNPPPAGGHNPRARPRQPSHRRRVQGRSRIRGSRAAANHQNAYHAI